MARLTYIAPLLVGVVGIVGLTGCPSDDSPAETDSAGTSTGPDDTTTTTTAVPTTSPTTTVDPDSSSGEPPGTTTDTPPTCEPACGADECCVGGMCFNAPDPDCNPACADGELCQFPDGADVCTDQAVCVPDVGLCPGGWGAGNYDQCVDDTGMPNSDLCEAGSICVSGPNNETACSTQGCTEMCDCPEPPATGDAPVTCADVTMDMVNECYLSCEADETCPAGMSCFGGFVCIWPIPQPQPGYHNCSLTGFACQIGEDCVQDGDMMTPATWAVCSQPGCMTEIDCEFDAPTTGDAPVTCADPTMMGGANTCYLDCSMGQTCPDGMSCRNDSWCAWDAGSTLFFDDFQTADFSMGWTLTDVDGRTPADPVAFVDAAWVVTDQFDGGAGANLAAYSNSWYNPAGQADDWMVSPQLMIGANARLSWLARAQDPAYPDGYEVRISTAGPDVADFVDAPVFTIASEAPGDYVYHSVDLAPTYANQMIYVAFRNHSVDQFVLLVDEVAVVDFP